MLYTKNKFSENALNVVKGKLANLNHTFLFYFVIYLTKSYVFLYGMKYSYYSYYGDILLKTNELNFLWIAMRNCCCMDGVILHEIMYKIIYHTNTT